MKYAYSFALGLCLIVAVWELGAAIFYADIFWKHNIIHELIAGGIVPGWIYFIASVLWFAWAYGLYRKLSNTYYSD